MMLAPLKMLYQLSADCKFVATDPVTVDNACRISSADKDTNVEDEKLKKRGKPVYLKDYERERLLEKGR